MSLLVCVRAVKNLNSGQTFVLVDDSSDQKMTIINPKGDVLTVPKGLFAEPFTVRAEQYGDHFSDPQIASIDKAFGKGRRKSTSKTGTRKRTTKKKEPLRFGIGAEWNSSKLTFYKHKIEPLSETQSFKINIEKTGTFLITKSDFQKMFNDVVISNSYWEEGSFTYGELPEKAKKFIKAA